MPLALASIGLVSRCGSQAAFWLLEAFSQVAIDQVRLKATFCIPLVYGLLLRFLIFCVFGFSTVPLCAGYRCWKYPFLNRRTIVNNILLLGPH